MRIRILTFNTLGIPLITKDYKKRFEVLVREISKVNPDIVCLQELWIPKTKRMINKAMYDLGYKYTCSPRYGIRLNGLATYSKFEIISYRYLSLKPIYKFQGNSLLEFPGDKGYLITRMGLGDSELIVFNTHLVADLSGTYREDSVYGHISFRAVGGLSALIQEAGKEKMVICGDFNFEPGSWLHEDFSKVTGAVDRIPEGFRTITNKDVFIFPVSIFGKRVDYIFTKNIDDEAIKNVRVVWDKKIPDVGYLSDHAGLLVDIEI